jgi:hypothetical protein
MQFCAVHRDFHLGILVGRWQLHRIVYVIPPEKLTEIKSVGFSVDFAVRYFKDIVQELGVEIEFREELDIPVVTPERVYATSRPGKRLPLVRNRLPLRRILRAKLGHGRRLRSGI